VRSVKAFPILAGARGGPAAHLASLEDTLLRLNQLMAEVPEIQELDINPFFASDDPAACAAADARITLAAG